MTRLSLLSAALRKSAMLALCVAFVLVLWTPTAVTLLGIQSGKPLIEQRQMAAFPTLPKSMDKVEEFPAAFSAYYADSFGLRNFLIRAQGWWKYHLFDTGNDFNQEAGVIVGKEGWLFGGGVREKTIRREKPFYKDRFDHFVSFFSSRGKWAADRGTPFIIAFAPMQGAVYPEYLPDWCYPIREESYLDQIMPTLNKMQGVQCISLLDALLEGKQAGEQVFYKTDGHWTTMGAHYGAKRIAAQTYEMLGVAEPSLGNNFKMVRPKESAGRQSYLLALDTSVREKNPSLVYTDRIIKTEKNEKGVTIFKNPKLPNAPTVFVFHDSFGRYGFEESFPQHFSTAYFAHYEDTRCDMSLVQQYKPDAVVLLLAEWRLLAYQKPPIIQPKVATFTKLPWRLDMSSAGNSRLVAGSGWAPPEKDGCWTSPHPADRKSRLVFPKPSGALALTVSCCAPAMADQPDGQQRVLVYANDVQVGEWSVGKERVSLRAEIPKAVACKAKLLTISFAVPAAADGKPANSSEKKMRAGIKLSGVVLDALK